MCGSYLSNDFKSIGFYWMIHYLLGHSNPSPCLEFDVALTDKYNIRVVFLHHSIDIDFTLLHVKLKGGLSISVLRNKTTLYEKGVRDRKISKKVTFVNSADVHP